jgi:hypothetical protein
MSDIKFYSIIEKSLNKEPNYNLIITNKKGQINCYFYSMLGTNSNKFEFINLKIEYFLN